MKKTVNMNKADNSNKTGKFVKTALDMFLKVEANSASCVLAYQPKAPEALKKFRKD